LITFKESKLVFNWNLLVMNWYI